VITLNIPLTDDTKTLLAALGFVHTHYPAEWEDVGNSENGPKLSGHNAFDVWAKGNLEIGVEDGIIVGVETVPPDFYADTN
jgi:hypothetical protein